MQFRPSDRAIPIRWFPLAVVLAVSVAVRLWVIDRDALWLDEGYSWWDARQPLAALFSRVPECDPHPPFYFALLHAWIAVFGDGTIAMRALSTLFGTATVFVVWLIGREVDAARARVAASSLERPFGVAALGALLFALTPFQIYFSVEARPYALLCFGASLLTLGLVRFVSGCTTGALVHASRPATGWRRFVVPLAPLDWSLIVVGAAIMVWTNNTAVLCLAAATVGIVGLWLVDRDSRGSMLALVAAGVVVAVVWAPDWPVLIGQMREVTEDFWIQPANLQNLTFELHNLVGLDVLRSTWWMVLLAAGGLLAVAWRVDRRLAWMLAALIVLPVAFNVLVSVLMKPILISRAMIGIAPAFAVALASAVLLFRPKAARPLVALLLVGSFAIAASRYLSADHVKEPWKPVVARLAAIGAGRPILVVPNELALPLEHQARRAGVRLDVHGMPADYPAIGMAARYPSGKCAPSVVRQDLSSQMAALRDAPQVILLTRLHNTYDPDEALASALKSSGFAVIGDEVYQPGDLRIVRFARSARPAP